MNRETSRLKKVAMSKIFFQISEICVDNGNSIQAKAWIKHAQRIDDAIEMLSEDNLDPEVSRVRTFA